MGEHWDVDEILERALQEEDLDGMDSVIARLVAEEGMSRSAMLRRSFAAAAGLTILAPATAFAREQRAGAAPPVRGKKITFAKLVKQAKKEGEINTIALPPDWANYGEIMATFKKKYGLKLDERQSRRRARRRTRTRQSRSLKGDSRAPDVLDVGPSFAIAGANEGLYAKYFNTYFGDVPRAMKDGRGFWVGDYWGVISFGVNRERRRRTSPKTGPTC